MKFVGQEFEMAEAMGIGKCQKCGIVTHDPKNHGCQKRVV